MAHSTETVVAAEPKVHGIIATFAGPNELLQAAARIWGEGYRLMDAHSPFPIHGMDDILAEKRSRVSYIAAGAALGGGTSILALAWWVHTVAYPLVISGKPFFSYQAFFPPIFAITVLSAAFGALIGFMVASGLKWHQPLFTSDLFAQFSDDGFIISIEAKDKKFDQVKTAEYLKSIGAGSVELIWSE